MGQVLRGLKGDEEMPRGSSQQSWCGSWSKKGGGPAFLKVKGNSGEQLGGWTML